MEKRELQRWTAELELRFYYWNLFYPGTILDISEKGMFIKTDICIPREACLPLIIRTGSEMINISVEVKHVVVTDNHCTGLGVEVLKSNAKYHNFLNSLMNVYR
ncbi:MAG: hypothetical protein ABFR82_05570 [Nitrospirota bacterium]